MKEDKVQVKDSAQYKELLEQIESEPFERVLDVYYKRLYPFKDIHKWLSYGDVRKGYFSRREWSFTLANDAYIRFQSFRDADSLQKDVIQMKPVKIDIGAVYNIQPKDKKTVGPGVFKPLERELVFDIDMTDYDEIRPCCSGAAICNKCWGFMTIAIKVLHYALTVNFGFSELIWIYSGRRGVHCWISDERARTLSQEARKAIVSYLEVISGGGNIAKKVNLGRSSHPFIEEVYNKILIPSFESMVLGDLNILADEEYRKKLFDILPDRNLRSNCEALYHKHQSKGPEVAWDYISNEIKSRNSNWIRDIIFQYTYPRLDSNVSIGLNHLLKAPFCIHPKTEFICVPINPEKCEEFDPLKVPNARELVAELGMNNMNSNDINYKNTSLKPYIDDFKKYVNTTLTHSIVSKKRGLIDMSF